MGILKAQFCENLRLQRQSRKWSQENIADMLQMSHSGYAKIERGETDVSLEKIEDIANIFEMSVFELLKPPSINNISHFKTNIVHTLHNQNQLSADASLAHRLSFLETEIVQMKFLVNTLLEKIEEKINS